MEAGARKLAAKIKADVPPGLGFTLFLYEYGGPGKGMAWISTGERSDMVLTMVEWLDHHLQLPKGESLIEHVGRHTPKGK